MAILGEERGDLGACGSGALEEKLREKTRSQTIVILIIETALKSPRELT